jgi:hypothetical protein
MISSGRLLGGYMLGGLAAQKIGLLVAVLSYHFDFMETVTGGIQHVD